MGNDAYPVAALENHVRWHERSQEKGGRRDCKVNMFISVPPTTFSAWPSAVLTLASFGRVSRPPNLQKTVDHSNSLCALAFVTAYRCPLSFNFPLSLPLMLTSEHICLLPPHGATPFLHFFPLSFVSGWSLSSQLSRLWCLSHSRLSDNVSIKWVFFRFTGFNDGAKARKLRRHFLSLPYIFVTFTLVRALRSDPLFPYPC